MLSKQSTGPLATTHWKIGVLSLREQSLSPEVQHYHAKLLFWVQEVSMLRQLALAKSCYHWSTGSNTTVLWEYSKSSAMKIATYIDYGPAYLSEFINRINTQQKKELKILWYHYFKNYKLKN